MEDIEELYAYTYAIATKKTYNGVQTLSFDSDQIRRVCHALGLHVMSFDELVKVNNDITSLELKDVAKQTGDIPLLPSVILQ